MAADPWSGGSWWQVAGALAAVFGLLVLVLRALRRWQPADNRQAAARLLSVQRLGPRRELQRLRVGETVHTLYRQDGAMVVLASEPWTAPAADRGHQDGPAVVDRRPRLLALLAAAGGAALARPGGDRSDP